MWEKYNCKPFYLLQLRTITRNWIIMCILDVFSCLLLHTLRLLELSHRRCRWKIDFIKTMFLQILAIFNYLLISIFVVDIYWPDATPGKFPCPKCNKCYVYKRGLRRHLKFQCGKEKQFKCMYCPKRSALKYNLIQHMMVVHRVPKEYAKRNYRCE